MSQLGSLSVRLSADIAEFQRDLGKASQTTTQAMNQINGALDTVKNGLKALGIGASVGAFAAIIKGSIDAADNLRDMSQKTGIAVESLNGLGFASGQAGGSLESMVSAAGKLNKSLAEARDGNGEAAKAFKALGISVKDAEGNLKKADVVMAEVADQFAKYQDGPEKAALALRLFGKAGADMIPLLNDGGAAMRENIEYAKRYSGATTELSDMADNFNDTMGKLRIQQQGFINQLSAEMLPVMQSVANAFLDASEKANELNSWSNKTAEGLKYLTGVAVTQAFVFDQWSIKIGGTIDKLKALKNLDFKGAGAIGDQVDRDLAKSNGDYQVLHGEVKGGGVKDRFATPLASVEKLMAEQREFLTARNAMANKYQNEGLMSQKAANEVKIEAQAEYVSKIKTMYGYEIKILSDAKAVAEKVEKNPAKAKDIQARIDDLYKAQSFVGTDKPNAPKLPTAAPKKTDAQRDAERAIQEGARMVAKLKEQDEAYGLSGAALLEYQLKQSKIPQSLKDEALAHQVNIDAMKAAQEQRTSMQDALQKMEDDDRARRDQNAANVEQIKQSLMSELEAETAMHESRIAELQAFHDDKLENVAQANMLLEAEDARHKAVLADMDMQAADRKIQMDMQVMAQAAGVADQMYSMLQQAGLQQSALGKAAFLASKGLAVAQIIMNTNVAAAAAMAMPPLGLGPIAGMGLAATIKGMGYASAAMTAGIAIAGAREKGGPVWSGGTFLVGEKGPELFTPATGGTIIPNDALSGGGRPAITINSSPQISIDSRTDQRDVYKIVSEGVARGNADLVDKLQRAGLI